MKRTSKICALLFCAMLWFNPVGAQQKKTMPAPENSGTELKMDKAPLMMQRQKAVSVNKMQAIETDTRLMQLSEAQKTEMVKSYMQAAFAPKKDMATAPKAGGIGPKTFIGGAYLSQALDEMGFTTRFTIDEDGEPSLVEDMESPIFNAAQGLSGFPLNGTWTGQYFEGNWAAMNTQGQIAGFFGYYIYDPASDNAQKLVNSNQTGLSVYDACIAYDYSTSKVFAIQRYEHQTDEGAWVCDSNVIFSATPNTGVYTPVAKLSGITESVMTMAITKEGAMYAIALDGKLYSINTSTWVATVVGSTGIDLADFGMPQAMAADYRSGKLYWNYVVNSSTMGLAEVNASTGSVTSLGTFGNVLTSMASLYYINNQPKEIVDFGLSYENAKVRANFKVPALTVNDDEISQLDTVEIFKVVDGSLAGRVWAKQNPVPGEKIRQELENLGTAGETVTLAVRVKDKNGKYSAFATAQVLLATTTLPYVNGFESNETAQMSAILITDPQNNGGMERSTEEYRTGEYSFKMSGLYAARDSRKITIYIPVKKGGVYGISLWTKTTASANDGMLFAFDGADFAQYFSVSNTEWTRWTQMYEATATGQMALTLQPYGGVAQDINAVYFIDDIQIWELVSPDVPATFTINSVTPDATGELQATLNITLPSEMMSEETLLSIDSIEFHIAKTSSFSAATTQTVIVKEGLTPGATKDVVVDVPSAGQYYIRGIIYNENGSCPYYSQYVDETGRYYQKTPWIGPDNIKAVTITSDVKKDGSTVLSWTKAVGSYGGYIGTVTYTIKDGETSLYSGTDTTHTLTGLTKGLHMLSLVMTNDKEKTRTQNAYTLSGMDENATFWNVAPSGGTMMSNRAFYTNTTATNSGLSQVIYPASGKAMYIDTLLLFTTAPTTGEAKQYTKIYMGTTQQEGFAGTGLAAYDGIESDFIEKKDLTEVFADTLRFKEGENTLKLPLKGFYYNGEDNLVITFVKPLQAPTTFAAVPYTGVAAEKMSLKYLSAARTNVSMDTVNFNDYTGYVANTPLPMVAMANTNLKTLQVSVKWQDPDNAEAPKAAVAGVSVRIYTNPDAENSKNLEATVITDENGVATFDFMPEGDFRVVARKVGYVATQPQTLTVNAESASPVTMEILIDRAKPYVVSGKVKDKGDKVLAGVAVKADDGIFSHDTVTLTNGTFSFKLYGSSEYELVFEKAGMKTYTMQLGLGEKDSTLADVAMDYVPAPVSSVNADVNEEGKMVVNWTKPAVSEEISWTKDGKMARRLTVDQRSAFKYAQRFLPADLAKYNMEAPKALQMGFVPGSELADYTLVLAYDTTHEIFRKEINKAELVEGEWYFTSVNINENLDFTRQLWLIVEVAASEDQGYACAATNTTVADGKSNLIYAQGTWYKISDVFTSGNASTLVSLNVADANTLYDAANGYKVYRGLVEDDFEDFELLTENPINTLTYTDQDWAGLEFGQYVYAVTSDWYDNNESEPVLSQMINKDMRMQVKFVITSNAGSAKGAEVLMLGKERNKFLSAVADEKGEVVFDLVWRDEYVYSVEMPYHTGVLDELNLIKDTVIKIALQEVIVDPVILSTKVEGVDLTMNWGINVDNWEDDVESYEDFAIENIGDYILSEPVVKGLIEDVTWTNYNVPQSWIVFNPSKTSPAMNLPANSGKKMFAAFFNSYATGEEPQANNDYLIRPVSKGGGVFQFSYKAYTSNYPEAFEVVYSSTTSDLSAFKSLKEYDPVTVTNWTTAAVEVPEDAKFVGVRCTSEDAFIFLVDDLAYYVDEPANPTQYELYLDGEKKAETKEFTYTFEGLSVGEHKVGVKAIYASGASELVEKTVTIAAEVTPIRLNVEVEVGTAVLTWDMPEGFTPKSYKVFLGGELKAENLTEKTYTFSDLKNGTYTAAVVAVYETGESEKATVEFEIKGVDVEDFVMEVRSKVYPNPNNGMFYLQAADKGLVEVYAMNGQLVKRVEIPAQGTYSINLQNRTKGMYLLRFMTAGGASYFKVMVR